MPRPKGSRNKTVEQPKEFDYERDDPFIDGAYQATTAVAPIDKSRTTEVPNHVVIPHRGSKRSPTPEPTNSTAAYSSVSTLYLVEGDVQLSSREPGRGSMVAKQTRLVEANSDLQAVEKFSDYFNRLSDAESVYTVVRAAAMDTIR